MLDVRWFEKMIFRSNLKLGPVTLSQLRKKKLFSVLVSKTKKDAICKWKNYDLFEIIYFLSFDGVNFETVTSSKCDHGYTLGLTNYRGSPMTTGSAHNTECFVKTEVYNFHINRWNDAPDYPFSS